MYLDYFTWGLYVLITFFSIYLIVCKKDWVKKHQKEILFLLVGILLYSQYQRYFDRIFTNNFSYEFKDFPLNYCRITAILTVIYIFTKNEKLAQFIYFQAGLGFFSVLFPGGDFFMLTQNHRAIGYIYDHYVLAIMPVFLIFIMNIRPTKKTMYFAIGYSLIIPFSLLPYALNTGHNVFYILDGVFIPLVFGNNQVVISIVYVIGTVLYNILMYRLSFWLTKKAETESKEVRLLKPLYPFIILVSYLLIGIIVGSFFINNVPKFIDNTADTYNKEPIKQLDEFAYIYEGTIDSETVFFIEIVEKYEELIIMDEEGNFIPTSNEKDIYYYKQSDSSTDNVIIIMYKNKDQENEKIKSYAFGN